MDYDATKVKITNGFEFGYSALYGAIVGLLFAALGAAGIDWLVDRYSDHKEKYAISFGSQYYATADYERRWGGQVIFYECESGDRVIVNQGVGVIKIARVDPQAAKTCKAQ